MLKIRIASSQAVKSVEERIWHHKHGEREEKERAIRSEYKGHHENRPCGELCDEHGGVGL